ncbi:hypothetical protein, partial [Sphingopyxis sp. NFH-91]|uniref:hypothetical protein n=1 Tax=Sphingopyxis sp. NFH-91 TaxID=2744457 RepID=UPI001F3051DD
ILSSVIVFFSRFEFASEPYQKIDGGHPFRETFLHHPLGHDQTPFGLFQQYRPILGHSNRDEGAPIAVIR